MKSRWIAALALLVTPAFASALGAEEMLQKIDAANNPFKDRTFKIKMTIREPSGSTRVVGITAGERGRGRQRIMIFTEPADVKGMGVLSVDRNTIYVYLPSYHRVRRVAMHARRQSFQGSDFTFDDMAQIRYSEDFAPKLLSEEGGKVVLELTPRPGRDVQYKKVVLEANRKTWLVEKLEYFDENGKLKTETRGEPKMFGGLPMQTAVKMVDERTKHSTEVEVTDVVPNPGLSRRVFSKRGLVRGKL